MKRSEFLKSVLFAAALPKLLPDVKANAILTGKISNELPDGITRFNGQLLERPLTPEEAFMPNRFYNPMTIQRVDLHGSKVKLQSGNTIVYNGGSHYQGINFKRFTDLSE